MLATRLDKHVIKIYCQRNNNEYALKKIMLLYILQNRTFYLGNVFWVRTQNTFMFPFQTESCNTIAFDRVCYNTFHVYIT